MANPNNDWLKRLGLGHGILFWGLVLTLWTSGCVHSRQHNGLIGGGAEVSLPELASVTTWPLAVLLTNGSAFESEITMTLEDSFGRPLKLSGQLLVRGGTLRLEVAKSNGKALRAGDFGVIWDADARQGFVFSEALQGFSPINEAVHCTNLLAQVVAGDTERLEGHSVDMVNVTLLRSDGQTMVVQMLRSQDPGHLPLKIYWPAEGPYAFTLALSSIQLLKPADELFVPPDGFTKYGSEAAMLNELADRQQSASGEKHERGSGGGENNPAAGNRRSQGAP